MSHEEQALMELTKKGSLPLKSIKIDRESVERMNDSIIDATNNVVDEKDNLVILGDFCWGSTPKELLSKLISKIRCKNLYLIWGNHDNKQILKPFFKATYDQYTFCIEGQHIFVSHYPSRSWYLSNHGSWMLYGHVHNNFWHQDNGLLNEIEHNFFQEAVDRFVQNIGGNPSKEVIEDFKKSICSVFRKSCFYTLDVGVDNVREGVPFGTPWSFQDIKVHMERKNTSVEFTNEKVT